MKWPIRKARYKTPIRGRVGMAIIHILEVLDALVFTLSLGYLTCDLRSQFLFSDLCDILE